MKLFNILNDEYITERDKGLDCESAFIHAYSSMKDYVINHFDESLAEEFQLLKDLIENSYKVTQQIELNYKMGVEL